MEDKTIQVGGGDSYISYDENTNEIIFNGANVVTTQPGIGDILCHDENRKYKFIRCDTYQGGIFPAAWETLGVVAMRKGNRVWVVAKENATKKFMDVYPYVVTGYELDGAEHTAQLRLHGKPTKSTFYDFKYTASSVDEFVSQLQQFLTANAETDWSAYKDAQGRVILQYNNYTLVEYYMTTITYATGLTLTGQVLIDCPQQPSWIRKCGNWGYGVWHAKRAKEYFKKDLTNTSFNPSSDLTGVPSYPIC